MSSKPVRTAFDLANPGMPPALEILREPTNLRRYAPHPCAPRIDEEEAAELDGRSFEQWGEDEQGYHGSDRR